MDSLDDVTIMLLYLTAFAGIAWILAEAADYLANKYGNH